MEKLNAVLMPDPLFLCIRSGNRVEGVVGEGVDGAVLAGSCVFSGIDRVAVFDACAKVDIRSVRRYVSAKRFVSDPFHRSARPDFNFECSGEGGLGKESFTKC